MRALERPKPHAEPKSAGDIDSWVHLARALTHIVGASLEWLCFVHNSVGLDSILLTNSVRCAEKNRESKGLRSWGWGEGGGGRGLL